jgi:hypothetical protein
VLELILVVVLVLCCVPFPGSQGPYNLVACVLTSGRVGGGIMTHVIRPVTVGRRQPTLSLIDHLGVSVRGNVRGLHKVY